MIVMTREDFVQRFQKEFTPSIEVQQLPREFQELRQTTETVLEITAIYGSEHCWFRSTLWMRR